jgi:flavodoxin
MKTLIIFYSYSGSTKAIAEQLATAESADITEIKDLKRPGKLKAYTAGIFAAGTGKAWKIQSIEADMTAYDRLILFAPVWANNPPPPFNALLELLPEGKAVSVKLISMSGKSDCKERIARAIIAKGCILENFEDIKVNKKKQEHTQ